MPDGLIAALPYPRHFHTFNWLDYVKKRVCHLTSRIVNSTLSKSVQFRQEVNQAIVKIILLPDHVIEGFVSACVPERQIEFIELIKSRRDRLQILAAQDSSFQTYLSTTAFQIDAQNLTAHLCDFKAQGQFPILQHIEQRMQLARDMTEKAIEIRLQLKNVTHEMAMLKEINRHQVPWEDPLLSQFIYTSMSEICNNEISGTKSSAGHNRLTAMLASIHSPEIIDVNEMIVQLASRPLTQNKANRIAEAFRGLPLDERRAVISTRIANSVQQELARHRFFPHAGKVYLKGETIDTSRAANAFKSLKTKYPPNDYGQMRGCHHHEQDSGLIQPLRT